MSDFKEIADRLLNSSFYEEIDEVDGDIAELLSIHKELEKENERLNQQGAFFAAKSEELERKLEVARLGFKKLSQSSDGLGLKNGS
jgi:hypothetical protein